MFQVQFVESFVNTKLYSLATKWILSKACLDTQVVSVVSWLTCRTVRHSPGWSRRRPCTEEAASRSKDWGSSPGSSGSTRVSSCWRSWCSPTPRTSSPWRSRRSRSASPASSPGAWADPDVGPGAGTSRLEEGLKTKIKQLSADHLQSCSISHLNPGLGRPCLTLT